MKIKTYNLIGPALDWAVVFANGQDAAYWLEMYLREDHRVFCTRPSIQWSQGGPIIERELICYNKSMDTYWAWLNSDAEGDRNPRASGPTLLIAAMRCYVTSKLGDEIEIPEEYA